MINAAGVSGGKMALQKCGLNLNQKLKELQPHGTLDFPCGGYSARYLESQGEGVPWHWHEELEVGYVADGTMEVKVPSQSFLLEKGDGFAINSNVLHSGAPVGGCEVHSMVFLPSLIYGKESSVFAEKYIKPLLACHAFAGSMLSKEKDTDALKGICQAFDGLRKAEAGFEFTVRENLSKVCFFLTRKFEAELAESGIVQNQDNERIRKMLTYIHQNYSDKIALLDIARAADIGERECLRCFQKTIQLSPIQYLLKYRIMRGAQMLLDSPRSSISEIAGACGFDSPSNFSQMFRRFYRCTPKGYRKEKMRTPDPGRIL